MMTPRKHNLTVRMLKRAARLRREHGMALLFTLCILSMALITAMIFSSTSSTSRKVAAAYVDSSSARILADGVVNRALLALMRSENASYACSNYNTSPPTENAAKPDEYASDWIWKLEKSGVFSFDDGPLRFNKTSYYDVSDPRCPSWEYVFCKNYGADNTDHIAGRYAYVAIGLNDQLNPNALGRRNYNGFDNSIFEKRLGRWPCEPQFIFRSTRNGWNYSSLLSPDKVRLAMEKNTTPEGWTEIDMFLKDLSEDESATDPQFRMMVDQYFDLSNQGEYNKFRTDGKAIGDLTQHTLGSNEAYRFPVIRNDWDSISVDTVKSEIPWFGKSTLTKSIVDQTVANLINYNASINRSPVTDNENWFTGTPSYTGNKRTAYINEAQAEVSVGGNLGVRLAEHYLEDPNNPTSWKWRVWYTACNYSHEITINVETVNMYQATGGSDGTINVKQPILIGEISYQYQNPENGEDWRTETIQFDASTEWGEITESGDAAGYKVYTFMLDRHSVGSVATPKKDGYDKPMGHEADFYEYMKIRNVKLSVDRIVLQDYAGRNADLALMNPDLQKGYTFPLSGGVQVAGENDSYIRSVFFDTQVNDPRCNLGRDQWSASFAEKEESLNATIGSPNNVISTGSNSDYEKTSDPVYSRSNSISTAYIRHAPMISLWELGAIHRGSPWQTINLKCAKKDGVKMENYEYGDGHLLDQVALTNSTALETDDVIGMINLNCVANFGGSSAPFVFKSLFTEFPVYQTYANMYNGSAAGGTIHGKSVDSDDTGNMDADAYAKELSEAVTYATTQGYLPRRTAVFPTSYPSDKMEKLIPKNVPDAQSEEIFCRVVNLLKWNKQPLKRATILVLAQSIRDVGGGVSLERNLPEKDPDLLRDSGYQAYNATKRTNPSTMSATNIRSAYAKRGVAFKQYDNFYDEITGESKIIVRLEWDESANENKGAWKITRKEYAE